MCSILVLLGYMLGVARGDKWFYKSLWVDPDERPLSYGSTQPHSAKPCENWFNKSHAVQRVNESARIQQKQHKQKMFAQSSLSIQQFNNECNKSNDNVWQFNAMA